MGPYILRSKPALHAASLAAGNVAKNNWSISYWVCSKRVVGYGAVSIWNGFNDLILTTLFSQFWWNMVVRVNVDGQCAREDLAKGTCRKIIFIYMKLSNDVSTVGTRKTFCKWYLKRESIKSNSKAMING